MENFIFYTVVGTSMVKDVKMKEVNKQSHNLFEKLRSFPGATWKYLKYYVVSSLVDETPGRLISHGGCNDVIKKNSAPKKIANETVDMSILCRGYGVNGIFISAMICRRSRFLIEKVTFYWNLFVKKMGTFS